MSGSALIGYTGFVGGTLYRAEAFDHLINSKNTARLRGGEFDLVVCAGLRAEKWRANGDPESDRRAIASLREALDTARVGELILISTIDVYSDAAASHDESAVIDPVHNHAYGRHRFEFECWARERFATTRIIRLPALFGEGLKKNAIYDLLHNNQVKNINPSSVFQWYPLRRLPADINRIRAADIHLINLFPEPIATSEILSAFFPGTKIEPKAGSAPAYRLRTRYSQMFGGPVGYMLDRSTVLDELARFIAQERERIAQKR